MTSRDYVAIARTYEAAVIAGRIPACQWVRLACERNARDLKRKRGFPYRFNPAKASSICAAIEQFPHIKGPDKRHPDVVRRPSGILHVHAREAHDLEFGPHALVHHLMGEGARWLGLPHTARAMRRHVMPLMLGTWE